ncbi:hydrogenase subunit MbhD domain-containing protein [Variovorax sp. M-6]|uniref:hydrogenase subunit MbhD domain-containing protein n=1 Tax=Variovorax sp. M-6 TaxID=3233041 RepID=UPI003F96CCEE
MTETLTIALVALLMALAVWTLVARDTFAAVAGFVPYGLLLTLAWLQLRAVDVAMTEAAIGAGLTGVLLIAAAARLRSTEAPAWAERPGALTRVLAAIVSAAVAAAIGACVLLLPDPAPTLAPAVAQNIAATGVGNPITAVLMSFRAMDTLLEAIVLLLGLIGIWSLAPDRFWGGRPGPQPTEDPNGILGYFARVLPPIGIVVGVYILWVGADHPGGKFQGATVLAAMWLLVMLAGLSDAPAVNRTWVRVALVGGPAVFVAIGLLGVGIAGAFLGLPEAIAKPLIVVVEAALLPSLAVTLALLLAGPPRRTDSGQ